MATVPVKQFDQYKVTNGGVQWKATDGTTSTGVKFGCTGELSVETEIKTIVKTCEGDEVLSVDIPTKMTGTFTGHIPVDVFRKAFGIDTKGLKKGVYAYGTDSRPGNGVMTWDVFDIFEEIKKMLAFPNASVSGGLTWSLQNGNEEIVEIEMALTFLKDENSKFYYEAFESEVEDADVKAKWHTAFTPELVAEAPPTQPETLLAKGATK